MTLPTDLVTSRSGPNSSQPPRLPWLIWIWSPYKPTAAIKPEPVWPLTLTQVRWKRGPSPDRPPVTMTWGPTASLMPRTSSLPLTFKPSDNTNTARSPGVCASLAPSILPAVLDCDASLTWATSVRSVVCSKRKAATDSVSSFTVVPAISPEVEHATTCDDGYAERSSLSAVWSSRKAVAPKATTSVRGESSAGSVGTLHVLSFNAYSNVCSCPAPASAGHPLAVVVLWNSTSIGSPRGSGVLDSENVVTVMVWLCNSHGSPATNGDSSP